MRPEERWLAREAKVMTREDVMRKAHEGQITWERAADICKVTPRHMRRLRERYQVLGKEGLRDGRAGRRQPLRIARAVLDELCRLKTEVYPEFSIRHFHQFATDEHGLELSYTMTRNVARPRFRSPTEVPRSPTEVRSLKTDRGLLHGSPRSPTEVRSPKTDRGLLHGSNVGALSSSVRARRAGRATSRRLGRGSSS